MRVRFFAVMSVSVMFLAVFAPAVLAQAENRDNQEGRDDRDRDASVSCLQVQNAFGSQGQYGNATAQYGGDGDSGGDGGETVAEVAQELGISQDQVLNCIGIDVENPSSGDGNPGDVNDPDDVVKGSGIDDDLPNTGGPPLLTTAFALALVVASIALLGVRIRRGP